MRWFLALSLIGVVAGCRYTGTYTCDRNDQCRSREAPGTCQLPSGLCSFPDMTCPMGQRYDDTAGDVAGDCVGMAVAIDAPGAFDPKTCPVLFVEASAAIPSRYRVLPARTVADKFPAYMTACEAELPGKTHAAVIDNAEEALALAASLGANPGPSGGQHYIGAIQSPTATMPGEGWINADGTPLLVTLFSAAQTEPDDADGDEGDHAEQVGAFTAMGVFDVPGGAAAPVICECDGKAVSPAFQAIVQATPFN